MSNKEEIKINRPSIKYSLINHHGVNRIGVHFEFSNTLNIKMKNVAGAKWSRSLKCWHIADTDENRKKCEINNKISTPKNIAITAGPSLKQPQSKSPASSHKQKMINLNLQAETYNHPALKLFLQMLQLKSYSVSTIKTYRNEFGIFLQSLGNVSPDKLSVERVKDYLQYCFTTLKLSENTIHSRMNALKFYYEQVLKREKFFWELPRPKKRIILPKVISEEKILSGLLKIENLKHKALLLLAYSAGLRVSEVVALKITDINSDRMQITINNAKGKKDRIGTLSKSILVILRAYYIEFKPKKWLFEGQNRNEPYSVRSAQTIFRDVYKNLNLPPQCSFHSLRHSYATHLLENGTDISYIQKLLGHNDIKTTLRYTQVSKKEIGKIESPLDKIMRNLT